MSRPDGLGCVAGTLCVGGPVPTMASFPAVVDVGKHAHLLEVLYHILLPEPADDSTAEADANGNFHDDGYDIEEQAADGGGVEE